MSCEVRYCSRHGTVMGISGQGMLTSCEGQHRHIKCIKYLAHAWLRNSVEGTDTSVVSLAFPLMEEVCCVLCVWRWFAQPWAIKILVQYQLRIQLFMENKPATVTLSPAGMSLSLLATSRTYCSPISKSFSTIVKKMPLLSAVYAT